MVAEKFTPNPSSYFTQNSSSQAKELYFLSKFKEMVSKNVKVTLAFLFLIATVTVPLGIFLKHHYRVVKPYNREYLKYSETLNFTGLDQRRWEKVGQAFQDLRFKNIELHNARVPESKLSNFTKTSVRKGYFGSFYEISGKLAVPTPEKVQVQETENDLGRNAIEMVTVDLFGKSVTDFEKMEQIDRENFAGELLTQLFYDTPVPFLNYRALSMNSMPTATCPFLPNITIIENFESHIESENFLYFLAFQYVIDKLITDTRSNSYILLTAKENSVDNLISFPLRYDRANAGTNMGSEEHPIISILKNLNTWDSVNEILAGLRDGFDYLDKKFPNSFEDINSIRSLFNCRDYCGPVGVFSSIINDGEKNLGGIKEAVKNYQEGKENLADVKQYILNHL